VTHSAIPPHRGIFCNRSLNLRSIRAIGYDMDYTLVHYDAEAWERTAYEHLRTRLAALGWPVYDLVFDPRAVIRGLLIDRNLGNLVKANRFGYVKASAHGTQMLGQGEKKAIYGRTVVDPDDARFVSLNTLFSLSEATMFAQLVDRLDAGLLPADGALGYRDLFRVIRTALDEAHMEGQLKADIMASPERFVEDDPRLAETLLDQKAAGLKLAVITNSEWSYTRFMLTWALDRHLPGRMTWRDIFDLVVVSARKPDFFESERLPAFALERDEGEGLLRSSPAGINEDGIWVGGNAAMVERHFEVDGSEVLYVGDHMYGDVRPSKGVRRWRTCLVLREMEEELSALADFEAEQRRLASLMAEKEALEAEMSQARLDRLHLRAKVETQDGAGGAAPWRLDLAAAQVRMDELRDRLRRLDATIAPLARAANGLVNERWGPILRTGKDKSALARHVEQHADLYTSRVSNFQAATPFAYFRAPYGSLPHDPGPDAYSRRSSPGATTAPDASEEQAGGAGDRA
jgi:HAD superfamily 5'-nucleotidase-like hydrolase